MPAGSSRCSRGLPGTRVPERASHCSLGPGYRVLAEFSLSSTTAQVPHRWGCRQHTRSSVRALRWQFRCQGWPRAGCFVSALSWAPTEERVGRPWPLRVRGSFAPSCSLPPPPRRGQHLSPMSVPKLHSHHGPQRKRRYLHCTPGAGEERTAIGGYPGAPATPGPAQLLGGTLLWHIWNPLTTGQLGSSALPHTPDTGPFREVWV